MDDETLHAIQTYLNYGMGQRRAEQVVEAFRAKGFVLRDVGGGDIVWQASYNVTGGDDVDLQIWIFGDGPRNLVIKLTGEVGVVIERESGGLQFWARSAKRILDTYTTFNALPVE